MSCESGFARFALPRVDFREGRFDGFELSSSYDALPFVSLESPGATVALSFLALRGFAPVSRWPAVVAFFAFDSELLMQAAHFGFRFSEVPCQTRYFAEASSVSLRQGIVYGTKTLWAGTRLVAHRKGIWRSRKFAR